MTAGRPTKTQVRRALLSLVVLGLLAVSLQSLVFSDASFSAGSANPAVAFSAGSLAHTNWSDGQVLLAADGLLPGGPARTAQLRITGGGTLSGAYTIGKVNLTDTPASPALSAALTLQITDQAGVVLYSGTPAAFTSANLGAIAPGVTRTYQVSLAVPAANAQAALQGASMALRLRIVGVSQ